MDPVVPVIISPNFLIGAQFHCLDIMQMIKKKRRGGGAAFDNNGGNRKSVDRTDGVEYATY